MDKSVLSALGMLLAGMRPRQASLRGLVTRDRKTKRQPRSYGTGFAIPLGGERLKRVTEQCDPKHLLVLPKYPNRISA